MINEPMAVPETIVAVITHLNGTKKTYTTKKRSWFWNWWT